MRLGQLARKYDLPVQDIVEYLEEKTGEKFHPNAKLYDAIETMVFDHFELAPTTPEVEDLDSVEEQLVVEKPEMSLTDESNTESVLEEPSPLPSTPEEDIALADGELAEQNEDEVPDVLTEIEIEPVIHEDKSEEPKEDEVIQTDRLIEMLESGEVSEDLDKIKLIKAPKRELGGLKVVGKIDLPEPKPKPEKKEKEPRPGRNKRPQLSEEEREKRRLKAKKRKEEYDARQERRRREKERKELQARKEAHYRLKLEKATPAPPKHKPRLKAEQEDTLPVSVEKAEQPKTALGRFWKWLNT